MYDYSPVKGERVVANGFIDISCLMVSIVAIVPLFQIKIK